MTSARIADYVVSDDAIRYKLLITKKVKKGSLAVFEDEKNIDFLRYECPRDYEAGETTWCKVEFNHRERLVLCHEDRFPTIDQQQQGSSQDFEVTFWDAAKKNDIAKFYRDSDNTFWEFHCRRDYARFERTSMANKLMYPSVNQTHPKKQVVVPCSDPARSRPTRQSASEEKSIPNLNVSHETSKIANSRKALSTKLFDLEEKTNLRKQLDISNETSIMTHSRKQLPKNYSEDEESKHMLKQMQLLNMRSDETTKHAQKRLYFDRYEPSDKENKEELPFHQKASKQFVAPTSLGRITTSNHVKFKEPPEHEPPRNIQSRVHFDRYGPNSKENKHGIPIHQTAKLLAADSNSLALSTASIFRNSKPPPEQAGSNCNVELKEITEKFHSDMDFGGSYCHRCGPTYLYCDETGDRCSGICGQFYCRHCIPEKAWLGSGSEDRYCSLDCTKHHEPTYRRYKKLQIAYDQEDSDVYQERFEDLSSIASFDDMDGY